MGAISGLLLLPVMAPVSGIRFVLERLHAEADAVLHDEQRAFAEIVALSMRRSELSEAEYAAQETQLLERLSAIRNEREQLQAELDAGEQEW